MDVVTRGNLNVFTAYRLARLIALWWTCLVFSVPTTLAENFSSGTDSAVKFSVHEIVLTGNGSVPNPFDTIVNVQFTPPSGSTNAKTVWAFYDGDNTWRARVYVSEIGPWRWESHSAMDSQLDSRAGNFESVDSNLRGRL